MLPLFGTPVLHNIELCPNFSNKNPAYWADFLLLQSACRLGSENYVRYSDIAIIYLSYLFDLLPIPQYTPVPRDTRPRGTLFKTTFVKDVNPLLFLSLLTQCDSRYRNYRAHPKRVAAAVEATVTANTIQVVGAVSMRRGQPVIARACSYFSCII